MELIIAAWLLGMATLWVARLLVEEGWAALRQQEPPRFARRRAREQLAAEFGTPTVMQALAARVAHRIAHPPRRQWAAELRAKVVELLVVMVSDGLAEVRTRHDFRHQYRMYLHRERARQQARRTWRPPRRPPRAGSSPAPPPPHEDVIDLHPCPGCRRTLVVDPDELCQTCTHPPPPPASSKPDPPPAPDHDRSTPLALPERTPSTMTASTAPSRVYRVSGNARDPRAALSFARECQGFCSAIAGQLVTLANNMRRAGVGPGAVGQINLLADAARSYAAMIDQSIAEYAQHILIQAAIYYSEDVRDTVRDTYLDTRGSDLTAPRAEHGATRTFNASDIKHPRQGAEYMIALAAGFKDMKVAVEHTRNNHLQQRMSERDRPVVFLAQQLERATQVADQATDSALRFRAHVQGMKDTVARNAAVGRTQRGKYLDPTKA